MTDVPRRPRQHDLATASTRAFETALPVDWVSSRHGEDAEYGIDLDVEIFDDGRTTGLMFHVQVKGTETLGGSAPGVSVRRTTWNYWKQIPAPVLVTLWERETGRLWWKWTHRHDTWGTDPASKTLTIPFDREWANTSAEEIAAEVRAWHAWDRVADLLPLSLTVTADDDAVAGVPCPRIAAELRRLALRTPHVLQPRPDPSGDLHFAVHIAAAESVMWVSGGPSATVHHNDHVSPPADDGETQHFVETLAAAHLLSIATMLARFGALGPAARVVKTALEHGAIGDPQTAGDAVALLFDAGRLDDALGALGGFVHSGDLDLAEAALTATMWATGGLDDDELLRVSARFEQWADEHVAANDPANMAGTLTYNAAGFSGRADLDRTLRLYDLAAERQPAYRGRGYWHRERAGALYHLGDHQGAADAYETAVDLGDERSVPLLADTFVLVGRYADARSLLRQVDGTDSDHPEWVLKRHLLDRLTGTFDVDRQDRKPDEADRLAETTDDPAELRRALAEHDLFCGYAHWKLAQHAHDHDEASFDHFLAAAIAAPDNPAAWLNAMLRSHAERPEMAMDVAMTARRLAGHDIVDMLLTSDDPADHRLAQDVDRLFHTLPADVPPPAEVRHVGQDAGQVISREVDFSGHNPADPPSG